ncbi:60S ribosomal protein L10a-2-like [Dermacentor silvarum]|uniref:60S ribosomal protein L10a-2-like n=1 Tax=Dermacentor silvarum TaxID=543639 RepID=UPI002100C502|nr:60S ribosomal protein L10a-2-like [Dermacentor silvarum]
MVDLLVLLKDYDFKKYKRLKGVIKLPHVVKPTFRGCMIGYNADRKEARACNLDFISVDEVMQLKGRPTAIKKLAARYDAFFAPKDYYLLRDLNKLLEQNFKKERKCITPVPLYMELDVKVCELRRSTRLWMRRELSFGISVGHVKMSADELAENVTVTVNEVLKRLKKGWENLRGLSVKSSMGPICKLY